MDDITLTHEGLSARGEGRVLILACGALAREILALIRLNSWHHMDLHCLPAILHNTPEKITDAVMAAILEKRDGYERIFVAYADCGTSGELFEKCKNAGVEMISGPHCYSFFEGNDQFDKTADDNITTFYLTDFLTRQFDAFVIRPLGLDRHPELRDMYFAHYEKLVYLAQIDDPELTTKAEICADRLGLKFERRFTGYGDLATALATQV